jgi:hypothetical protein
MFLQKKKVRKGLGGEIRATAQRAKTNGRGDGMQIAQD